MAAAPRLSIGLPVYNGQDYLAKSFDALLGQSYADFDLIISDNASTDDTAEICRHYQQQDSRIRYLRQPRNIGAAPNHAFVFDQSRGELFKWAAADDLYARDLIESCVEALDEHPEVVLAHSWTAAVDSQGQVTQAMEYPLATDSRHAPERFRSMLYGNGEDDFGLIRADDQYGVIRADVLRRVAPQGSYYHSDRTLMTEIALHGPFHQTPRWLYFRRDHTDRPQHALPTVRGWCSNLDPRRNSRLRHPAVRLYTEYAWGYAEAIKRSPLSAADKRDCYRCLAQWTAGRIQVVAGRALRGHRAAAGQTSAVLAAAAPPVISIDTVVPGPESRPT